LSLSGKVATTLKSLVIQPSQSHVPCGCTVFLGGSPCSDEYIVILY
jgi:hypothetical protein